MTWHSRTQLGVSIMWWSRWHRLVMSAQRKKSNDKNDELSHLQVKWVFTLQEFNSPNSPILLSGVSFLEQVHRSMGCRQSSTFRNFIRLWLSLSYVTDLEREQFSEPCSACSRTPIRRIRRLPVEKNGFGRQTTHIARFCFWMRNNDNLLEVRLQRRWIVVLYYGKQ